MAVSSRDVIRNTKREGKKEVTIIMVYGGIVIFH